MGFRYSRGRVDALLIEADYLADHPSRSGAIHARLACLDALVVTLDPIAAIRAGNTLAELSARIDRDLSTLCTRLAKAAPPTPAAALAGWQAEMEALRVRAYQMGVEAARDQIGS